MKVWFEFDGMEVEAEVNKVRDYYGTGDSPTLYDVEILRAIDPEGNVWIEEDLSYTVSEAMKDEAILYY